MEIRVLNVEPGDGVIRADLIVTEDAGDYSFLYAMIDGVDVTIHTPGLNTMVCRGQISDPGITIPQFAYEVSGIISDESNAV